MVHQLLSVPSASQWLDDALVARDMSQNRLARLLGVSAPQINRWVNASEKIPRLHLAEAARQLGSHADLAYVRAIKDCEESLDGLTVAARKLGESLGIAAAGIPLTMVRKVDALVKQEQSACRLSSAEMAQRYLTDAAHALRICANAHVESLVSPMNINRHLQYPMNIFIGTVLSMSQTGEISIHDRARLEDFAEESLDGFRSTVKDGNKKGMCEILARQHAIHLLARFGTKSDRGLIKDVVIREKSVDPVTKRLGFTGLILSENNPDITDKFVWELLRDRDLMTSSLRFDAMHYGDELVKPTGFYSADATHFDNTLSQLVRHIVNPDDYRSIIAIEVVKLGEIFDRLGPARFKTAKAFPRIRRLVEDDIDDLPDNVIKAWAAFRHKCIRTNGKRQS